MAHFAGNAHSAGGHGGAPMVDWLKKATLDLRFDLGELDPRIICGATTMAWLFDSQGALRARPHNFLLRSEGFNQSPWSVPGFSSVTVGTTSLPTGTLTTSGLVETSGVSEVHRTLQTISVTAGVTYTASGLIKQGERRYAYLIFSPNSSWGNTGTLAYFDLQTGTVVSTFNCTATIEFVQDGWYRCSITATATVTTSSAQAGIGSSVTGTAQTYVGDGSTAIFVTAAQLNQGELQPYYPTGTYNLLKFTEAFDNSAWTKTGSSVTSDASNSPFGTLSADKLVEASVTSSKEVRTPTFVFADASHYTASIYIKADTRKRLRIGFTTGVFGQSTSAVFDAASGMVVATVGAVTEATIEPVISGWFRCRATVLTNTAQTSSGNVFFTLIADDSTSSAYQGDGTSGIFMWGAQLVQGSQPLPYQPVLGDTPAPAPYFGPRINYNPVATPVKGKILAEEVRTNQSYNNTMRGAVVGRIGNGGVLPDNWLIQGAGLGTLNLDIVDIIQRGEARELVLEFSGTASVTETRIAFQPNTQVAATQGQTWALSAYMRRISGGMSNINGFDLSVVERTSGGLFTVDTLAPINISDTLQRPACVRTFDRSNTAFINSAIVLKPVVGQQVNLRFSVMLNQLELGPDPSSPMLTYGVPFTRSADNNRMDDLSWYSAAGGVLYVDYSLSSVTTSKGVLRLFDGTVNAVSLRYASGGQAQFQVTAEGSPQANLAPAGFNTAGNYRRAVIFGLNRFQQAVNGALPSVADTSGTLPVVNTFQIGHEGGGTSNLNGEISRIAFVADPSISDSALQRPTR